MKFTNFRIIRLRRKDLEELVRETISSTRIYGSILGKSEVRAALLDVSTI